MLSSQFQSYLVIFMQFCTSMEILIRTQGIYRNCHVTYQLKISSINFMLANQSQSWIRNLTFGLIRKLQNQICGRNQKVISHLTSLVQCKVSNKEKSQKVNRNRDSCYQVSSSFTQSYEICNYVCSFVRQQNLEKYGKNCVMMIRMICNSFI